MGMMDNRVLRVVTFLLFIGVLVWVNERRQATTDRLTVQQAEQISNDLIQMMKDDGFQPLSPQGKRLKPMLLEYKREAVRTQRAYDDLNPDRLFSEPRICTVAGRQQSLVEIAALSKTVDRLEGACNRLLEGVKADLDARSAQKLQTTFATATSGHRRCVVLLNAMFDVAEKENFSTAPDGTLIASEEAKKRWGEMAAEIQALSESMEKMGTER